MKILLTGATGLLGREIGKKLTQQGHDLVIISRDGDKAKLQCLFPCEVVQGDLNVEPLRDLRLSAVEGVVHLAGENVAEQRWSIDKKKRIYESRVTVTKNLIASMKLSPLRVFVSTSAAGFYGDRGDEILDEDSSPGTGFLTEVCRDWERAVLISDAKNLFPKARLAIFRLPMVLSTYGGGLAKMLPFFRRGLGGVVGNGRQWMPWIHIDDVVDLYTKAISSAQFEGLYNACAPGVVDNAEFTKILSQCLSKSNILHVPQIALQVIYGEMAHVLLSSQRMVAKRLEKMGYVFKFQQLDVALSNLLSSYQNGDEIFHSEQYFPFSRGDVFSFFSKPENLQMITPDYLQFKIVGKSTDDLRAGSMYEYKLKIHGVPVKWKTEILEVQSPQKFVDTQLRGPYSKWLHGHEFVDMGSGTLMIDHVQYRVPLGVLGKGVAGAWVARDVDRIFDFRRRSCAKIDFKKVRNVESAK